jgi:predicted anti-sigma-YlaC factor YlaD
VELVTDYLEGVLDDEHRERVEQHLGWCDGCESYLDQMRTTIRVTGRVREEDLSPEAREALLEAFRSWRRSP